LGAAYVFVLSGGVWSQQAELTGSSVSGGEFGFSVAIDGSTVVVGAPYQTGVSGAAYVFVRSGSSWSQQAELTGSGAAGGGFGWSVAISGSTVVVGADNERAAYVFVQSSTGWSQQARLTAPGSPYAFGISVALDGSTLVVGACGNANPLRPPKTPGAAYVFLSSGTAWSQQAKLTPSNNTAGDYFGYRVAVSGSTAVVGAPYQNAAYVFAQSGTNWSQQATLTSTDGAHLYGVSVALYGSTALVGSSSNEADMFVRSGTAWPQQAKLTPSDSALFGISVAINGSTAVVGAEDNNSYEGAAYVFAGA
jgi:hypothetical protein